MLSTPGLKEPGQSLLDDQAEISVSFHFIRSGVVMAGSMNG
jgi:hypothetical protein